MPGGLAIITLYGAAFITALSELQEGASIPQKY